MLWCWTGIQWAAKPLFQVSLVNFGSIWKPRVPYLCVCQAECLISGGLSTPFIQRLLETNKWGHCLDRQWDTVPSLQDLGRMLCKLHVATPPLLVCFSPENPTGCCVHGCVCTMNHCEPWAVSQDVLSLVMLVFQKAAMALCSEKSSSCWGLQTPSGRGLMKCMSLCACGGQRWSCLHQGHRGAVPQGCWLTAAPGQRAHAGAAALSPVCCAALVW